MSQRGGDPAPTTDPSELPLIDAYSIEANARPEQVWDVIVERVLPRFGGGFGPLATGRVGKLGTRILRAPYAPPMRAGPDARVASAGAKAHVAGTRTGVRMAGTRTGAGLVGTSATAPSVIMGFRVERAERPALIALAGEHRFARYSLILRVGPGSGDSTSRLSAETRAVFPGVAGSLYRAAVIGTGAHRLVVSRLLTRIRRLAQRPRTQYVGRP